MRRVNGRARLRRSLLPTSGTPPATLTAVEIRGRSCLLWPHERARFVTSRSTPPGQTSRIVQPRGLMTDAVLDTELASVDSAAPS